MNPLLQGLDLIVLMSVLIGVTLIVFKRITRR